MSGSNSPSVSSVRLRSVAKKSAEDTQGQGQGQELQEILKNERGKNKKMKEEKG